MLSNGSRGTLSYTDHSVQRRFKSNTPTDWISQRCLVITWPSKHICSCELVPRSSLNCDPLLICLAGGELAPRLSLVSPKVFSPFCHRWSFRSLPLSPLACSVGDTSLAAQSSTWLHRYYLNWTKLDNAITKFNNEMHSADNWVLNPVILHWQNLPILILCSALLQFVLLKALYK